MKKSIGIENKGQAVYIINYLEQEALISNKVMQKFHYFYGYREDPGQVRFLELIHKLDQSESFSKIQN